MPSWPVAITEFLWQNALAAVPLVLIVAAICKCVPCRPSTRHFLWLLVLVLLLAPRIAPPERLTRLVSAILPAVEANSQPPAEGFSVRSNKTAPDANPVVARRDRPIYDAADASEVAGTGKALGADGSSRLKVASPKAQRPNPAQRRGPRERPDPRR